MYEKVQTGVLLVEPIDGTAKTCMDALKERCLEMGDGDVVARARMQDCNGKDWRKSDYCTKGVWVPVSVTTDKDGVYFARGSFDPLWGSPERVQLAIDAHCNPKGFQEYVLDASLVEQLKDSGKVDVGGASKTGVLFVPWKSIPSEVPTRQYGKEPVFLYVFPETAGVYGNWLDSVGIENSGVYSLGKTKEPTTRPLWVRSLSSGSNLGGDGDLGNGGRVLGVRREQKISTGNEGIEQVVSDGEVVGLRFKGKTYVLVDPAVLKQ